MVHLHANEYIHSMGIQLVAVNDMLPQILCKKCFLHQQE